ncbi:MAG: TrbG/VirB9 family P-type conjugative transfer protein [Alphaproteobacteria bacterium]|nr:TrbG/VirB9 family P-type conjugative transfer protein [Alphaproteobacteria bacterium]MBN2779812.1 TrbG/VirB9 family P-type conjugative transfer protein [Alphaproteobacteria bacterium]
MKKIMFALFILSTSALFAQGANMQMDKYGVQPAWQNPLQNMGLGQSKPGYAKMSWSPDKILKVRLRDGMVTVINFPQWETIRDAYIGDSDFFDGRPVAKNVLMLSPAQDHAGADTNMIVFGASGNKYAFYLKSEPLNTDTLTHSIVDVTVPNSMRNGGSHMIGGDNVGHSLIAGANFKSSSSDFMENQDYSWIKNIPVNPTEFRFDLDIFVPNPDDYIIAPERVWRDQIFTYIDFGEKALSMTQRPVISILVEGGEAPVGFRTDGPNSRLLIVEAVGDMVLRNGQRLVCIKKREKPFLVSKPFMPEPEVYDTPLSNDPDGLFYEASDSSSSLMMSPFEVQEPFVNPAVEGLTINAIKKSRGDILPSHYAPLVEKPSSTVVLELASANTVNELQNIWIELSENEQFNKIIGEFEPFYAIDTNGVDMLGASPYSGNETYRLRVGPIKDVERGIELCTKLSTKNLPCAVVRVQ